MRNAQKVLQRPNLTWNGLQKNKPVKQSESVAHVTQVYVFYSAAFTGSSRRTTEGLPQGRGTSDWP